MASTGGSETTTLTANNLPSHTHTATVSDGGSHNHTATVGGDGTHTHVAKDSGSYGNGTELGIYFAWNSATTKGSTVSGGGHTHNVSISNGGTHKHTVTIDNNTTTNSSFSNMQPYIALNYIIKYDDPSYLLEPTIVTENYTMTPTTMVPNSNSSYFGVM